MKLKLQDITPELVRELTDEAEEQRIVSLTKQEIRALADELDSAVKYASGVLARCQLRAKRLEIAGADAREIAHMFDVPARTVTAWLKSPVKVAGVRSHG